jgi:hypothetical protein
LFCRPEAGTFSLLSTLHCCTELNSMQCIQKG